MSLLDWLLGKAKKEAEADRELQNDLHRAAAIERVAERVREKAALEEQRQASREQLAIDRQQKAGPAERAFKDHKEELRAWAKGKRQERAEPTPAPEKETEQKIPTELHHKFEQIKPQPTMAASGVTYVPRYQARQPVKTEPERGSSPNAAEQILAEADLLKKNQANSTENQRDHNPDKTRGGRGGREG